MQRYMVDNMELQLSKSDVRHITNVVKLRVNEEFEIVYDKIYTCKVTNIKDFKYEIISSKKIDKKKSSVIIACSLIKEQK